MSFTKITAVWSGKTGLPGYTSLRWNGELDAAGATTAAAAMRVFFNGLAEYIPQGVTISWDGLATIHGTNGAMTGDVSYTPPSSVTCSGTSAYSAASGAVIHWNTGLFQNGRRFRGRTFIVPLSNAFQTDGTIADTFRSTLVGLAATLAVSGSGLVVFGGSPTTGYVTSTVTGVSVPDRAAILRSRRD